VPAALKLKFVERAPILPSRYAKAVSYTAVDAARTFVGRSEVFKLVVAPPSPSVTKLKSLMSVAFCLIGLIETPPCNVWDPVVNVTSSRRVGT
jgi:hypothetical protein